MTNFKSTSQILALLLADVDMYTRYAWLLHSGIVTGEREIFVMKSVAKI